MLNLTSADLTKKKINTFVIPVCNDKGIHTSKEIVSLLKDISKIKEFKGDEDQQLILYGKTQINADRVVLFGIGKSEKVDYENLRRFAGKAVRLCIEKDLTDIVLSVPSVSKLGLKMEESIIAILEGAYLSNHLFEKYKSEKKKKSLKSISAYVKKEVAGKYRSIPSKVSDICEGTLLAREWVSTPSNEKGPEDFARMIASKAAGHENLKTTVINEKELKTQKFGAILAVSAGSQKKPRLVILEYNPGGAGKPIVLVGKGVTFDAGGLNLKSTAGIEKMKMDMAGAAAVAASVISIAKRKLKTKVTAVIPIVENMPSGTAYRPSDIIKSYSGKTIEIGNTDAEGRLILADAISFSVKKYKPALIVDLATLTGACVVSLGEKIAGVFSYDDKLAGDIISSGEKTFERCWRLPLPEDYKELIKSDFADIRNIGSTGMGGAITAALFLAEFSGDTKWAHIDIAGPAYANKPAAYCEPGGTGFGVRLIYDFVENYRMT